jgi:hypothetical protein
MNAKDFRTHKPVDRTDPGFTIAGHTLRWINGRVAENSPGRPWTVIQKEDLTPEILKLLTRSIPGAFNNGNTVRRGDLVLAYCPADLAKEHRQELNRLAKEQQKRIAPTEFDRKGRKVFEEKRTDTPMDGDLVERFKKQGG